MERKENLVGSECSKPQREKYVPSQINRLGGEIDRLEKSIELLSERLFPAKRNEPPADQAVKDEKCPEINCEIAEGIRQQVNRIVNLRDRIEYQIEMLEI